MGMMNGEGMLPIPMQMNNIMMMLQNPQLPQPMRMQLMMQHQQLQQMFVMQNMGGGQASMNNHLSSQSQCPPHMMQMNMMNGNGASNLNGMMSSNMGPKPPSSGISGGMAHSGPGNNRGRGGSHHFQQRSQPPRGPSANHSMNGSSAYQRLPTNGRRPNANKRGRSEDLIELQSGRRYPDTCSTRHYVYLQEGHVTVRSTCVCRLFLRISAAAISRSFFTKQTPI